MRFDNPAQLAVLSSSSGGSGLGGGRSSSNGAAGATEVGHPFVPALSVVIGGAARRRVGVGLPPAPDDALPSPTFSAIKLQPAVLSLSKRRSATGGCCSISGDGSCSPGTPPPAQPAAALGSGGHQQESNRDAPAGAAAAPQHPSTSSDGGRATGQQPRLQARWLDDLGGSGEGAESPPSSSSAAAPNLADKELSRLRAAMHKPAAPQEPDSPGGGFRPLATIPAELFARWSSGAGGEAAGAGPSASGGGSGASSTAGPSSQHGAADGPSGKAGGGVGGGSSSGSGLLVGGRKSTDARRSIEGRRSAQQSASGGGGRGAAAPTSLLAAASASPAGGWRELHGQGSASRVGGVNNSVSGSSGGGGVRGGSGSGVGRRGAMRATADVAVRPAPRSGIGAVGRSSDSAVRAGDGKR